MPIAEADLFPPLRNCDLAGYEGLPLAGKVLFRVGRVSIEQVNKWMDDGRLRRETDMDDVSDVMLDRFRPNQGVRKCSTQ